MAKPAMLLLCALTGAGSLALTGCVMKRTVTEGGQVVSEGYHVERPIRDAIRGEDQKDSH